MSRARGRRIVGWAGLSLVLLAACAASSAVSASAAGLSVQVDAPLVPDPVRLDVQAGGSGALVGVDAKAPLVPDLDVGLPVVGGLKTSPSSHASPTPSAGPAPPATPPSIPQATGIALGQAAGAAAMGAVAVAPGLPWEPIVAALGQWLMQAREAARPALRPVGRALRAIPFLAPLFSRLSGENLLQNPVRARVHEAIAQDPGLSVQDVRDRAGIAWGTTVHHLGRLERHGLVVSVRHGNHRRFFPANSVSSRQRRELAALAHPTAHRIASHVATAPGTDQKGLCRALDLQNPAASKHLTRFERLGLVQAETVGRSRLYHPTELLRSVLATLAGLGGVDPGAMATPHASMAATATVQAAAPAAAPARAPRVPLAEAIPQAPLGDLPYAA